MGGFLGIGNSSAKTDRGNQLAGINAEWNIYNRGLPQSDASNTAGTSTTASGIHDLESAKKYWQSILSGGRPAVMQAAAPAVNAVNTEADAQRNEQAAMGTARGGGATAANQAAESDRMAQINNIIAGVQPKAAEQVGQIGATEAGIGHQQMLEALQQLGLSADVAKEIVDSSIQSRPISMKANAEVRQQWSNALAAMGF